MFNTHIIGKKCVQQFAPLKGEQAAPLRKRKLVMAGISEFRPPFEIARINPFFHLILYTVEGSGGFETLDAKGEMREGEAWIFPARNWHHYWIKKSSWKAFWFHLADETMWRHVHRWNSPTKLNSFPERLHTLIDGYIDECHDAFPNSGIGAHAYAQIIGCVLDRQLSSDSSSRKREQEEKFISLWNEVNSKLSVDWTVEKMAQKLHVSKGHFHRLVEELYETTPSKLVQKFRMQHAERLLHCTDQTLDVIAGEVGYQTAFAFSKAFKKYSGISPSHFRKRFPER